MILEEINLNIDHNSLLETVADLNLVELLEKNARQIAVQHRGVDSDKQLTDSCNSLIYDWDLYDSKIHDSPPLRETVLNEKDFNLTCNFFKNTYVEELINIVKKDYQIYRGRFMMLKYKSCLSMHTDESKRLHIPIITNPDAFMVVDNQIYKLENKKSYIVDTTLPHTAVNAGKKDRIHLVFCV
jgi:hypothetical protein